MYSLEIFTVLLLANCILPVPIATEYRFGGIVIPNINFDLSGPWSNLDPMVVKNINVPEESLDINTHFPELKVTGLANMVIKPPAVISNDSEIINRILEYNMVAEGPVSVQFLKKSKELKGNIKYEAAISSVLTSPLIAGPSGPVEQTNKMMTSCEASNAKYTIADDFVQVLKKDPDASAIEASYDKLHDEHVKKVVCEINKAVVHELIYNILPEFKKYFGLGSK